MSRLCNHQKLCEDMGMSLELTGFDNVRRQLQNGEHIPDKVVQRRLHYLGLEMTAHARTVTRGHSSGGYDDQTGNLRSSIGFRIYKDGNPIEDGGFESIGGPDGVDKAKNALDLYNDKIPVNGWTLLVVAGMNYASAVESGNRKTRNGRYYQAKGYNVLHLTGVEMSKQMDELIKEFKETYS